MSGDLTGLSIEVPDTLYAGQTVNAIARKIPTNATVVNSIEWSITQAIPSDPPIATVTELGVVKVDDLVGPSQFNLIVTCGNYSETVIIFVLPTITALTLTLPPLINTSIGYRFSAIPDITWNDGGSYPASITYTSSNPVNVTIDSSGTLTAITNSRNTTITVYTKTLNALTATTQINIATRIGSVNDTLTSAYIYVNNITVGRSSQAYIVVYPYNIIIDTIVWSSSNSLIAEIDTNGKILGIQNGTVNINATLTYKDALTVTQTIDLQVQMESKTLIQSMILTPPSILGLQINGQYVSTLRGVLSLFPNTVSLSNVSWTSLYPQIATVNTNNNMLTITGISTGITTLNVVSNDRLAVSTTMIVCVQNGLKSNSTVMNTIPSTLLVSKTFQARITATKGTNNISGYYTAIKWSSSDETVATVSSNGLITAIAPGTFTLTVTIDGQVGRDIYTKSIDVRVPINRIILNPGRKNLRIGDTFNIIPTIFPENAYNKGISWESSNSQIATIDSSGIATGVTSGTVLITATAQDGGGVIEKMGISIGDTITDVTVDMTNQPFYMDTPVQATFTLDPHSSLADVQYWNINNVPLTAYQVNSRLQVTDTGLVIPGAVASISDNIRYSVSVVNQFSDIDISGSYIRIEKQSEPVTILSYVKAIELYDISGNTVLRFKSLVRGRSLSIRAKILPLDASNKTLEWSSSSESIATVNNTANNLIGVIQYVGPGTAYITVSSTDKQGIKNVRISLPIICT